MEYVREVFSPVIVCLLLAGILLMFFAILAIQYRNFRRLKNRLSVFIELTPPASANKAPEATQEFFKVLHGLHMSRSIADKLLGRKPIFALEVVSSKKQGIRYIARVDQRDASFFEQTVASYLPEVHFTRVEDFLGDVNAGRLLEFKQVGHFGYPLQSPDSLSQHDPIAYLTGAMTKLEPGELIVFQLVVSPTQVPEATSISNRLLHNEELVGQLNMRKFGMLGSILSGLNSLLFGLLDMVGEMITPVGSPTYREKGGQLRPEVATRIRPARTLTSFELELAESVHKKLEQPLFDVSIRVLVRLKNKESQTRRTAEVRAALGSFSVPKYQSLRPKRMLKQSVLAFLLRNRLPSIRPCILSSAELANMYHFPNSQVTKTENVVKSLSKTLPATISLKNGAIFDVIIGRNYHHGTSTDIGLTAAERERHVYIIGGTGNGKTTMMEYSIVQDIQNGKGVALIDPHGDFAEKILRYIPKDRVKDVIYFNPADLGYPIGLNLLELPEGLSGDELLDAKDFITEAVVSVMRKVFSEDDSGGHRIEYILRNTVQTALTIKDATLFTVFDLLTDAKYRKKAIKALENQKLKNFWNNEFGKAGDFQRVKMAGGVTAKIGRFQFSASAERIMSQPKSTINFEEILDGKILICNFAKGLIGEDTSELFGISVLAKLQLAAYRRVKKRREDRKPFFLYVDEFQNFATMSFVQMLSEARKYKLFLTMAEQSTSQQEDLRMVNTILANVGTVICFRSGSPADERLLLPLFRPYIEEGEIANLPTYNFYARISAVVSQEPISGKTVVLHDKGDDEAARKVINASRANYAAAYISTSVGSENKLPGSSPKVTKKKAHVRRPEGDV
jgi:hypothetical protein